MGVLQLPPPDRRTDPRPLTATLISPGVTLPHMATQEPRWFSIRQCSPAALTFLEATAEGQDWPEVRHMVRDEQQRRELRDE